MDALVHSIEHSFNLPIALVLAALAGVFSLVGIVLALLNTSLAKRYGHIAALLAGILLGAIAITHLIPESLHMGGVGAGLFILGLMIGWFLDKIGRHKQNQSAIITLTPLFAIGIHSFLDGMTFVASTGHSHEAGIFTGFGLIIHEIPEGIITYILCLLFVGSSYLAVLFAVFIASLTTPIGAILAHSLDNLIGADFLMVGFPISAGLVSWASIKLLSENLPLKKKKIQ